MTPLLPDLKSTDSSSSGNTTQPSPKASSNFAQPSSTNSQTSSPSRPSSRRLLLASLPPVVFFSSLGAPSTSASIPKASPSINLSTTSSPSRPVSPLRPPAISSPSIHLPQSPPSHATLLCPSTLSALPSTTVYDPSLSSLSLPPFRSTSAPISPPTCNPSSTTNACCLRGKHDHFQHAASSGLLSRFLRKAGEWLPWKIRRSPAQNKGDFVRRISIVASTPDGSEYLIDANGLIDSTTSGSGLIREGLLPAHMRNSMINCGASEGYNRVVCGREVDIRGKVEITWIGVNRKRGLVNLPRKRKKTWLYVAADTLEYDLIFGADTINTEHLFSEQAISAAVASNRIAPPPRPVQGPQRAEHYAIWLAERKAHAAQLTLANTKTTLTRASTMPCTTASSTLLTDPHPTFHQPLPQQVTILPDETTQQPSAASPKPMLVAGGSTSTIPEHPQFYLGHDGRWYARAYRSSVTEHS